MTVPPAHGLLAFVATVLVLLAIPGPNVAVIVSRSLALGRKAGLATVLGTSTGVYLQAILVAAGLGIVLERSVVLFTAVKLAGAGYLVVLGVQALRHRQDFAGVAAAGASRSFATLVRQGALVGLTNPKMAVFFTAMLPQFVDRARGHLPEQLLVLGTIDLVLALACDTIWACAAGAARRFFERSPRWLRRLGGVEGVAMIALGARLALSPSSNGAP